MKNTHGSPQYTYSTKYRTCQVGSYVKQYPGVIRSDLCEEYYI